MGTPGFPFRSVAENRGGRFAGGLCPFYGGLDEATRHGAEHWGKNPVRRIGLRLLMLLQGLINLERPSALPKVFFLLIQLKKLSRVFSANFVSVRFTDWALVKPGRDFFHRFIRIIDGEEDAV